MNPECPKCGETMVGPSYHAAWSDCSTRDHDRPRDEHLHFHCRCGYDVTRPTRDSQPPLGTGQFRGAGRPQ